MIHMSFLVLKNGTEGNGFISSGMETSPDGSYSERCIIFREVVTNMMQMCYGGSSKNRPDIRFKRNLLTALYSG